MVTRKMRGLSSMELLLVVIAISIVSASLIGNLGKGNQRAKIDIVYTDQSVFATDMEAVLSGLGVLELSIDSSEIPDDIRKKIITEYLIKMQNDYLHTYLDFDTLIVSTKGFSIYTLDAVDPWGEKYKIKYSTAPAVSGSNLKPGNMYIISGGPNMLIEDSGYGTLQFSDDKVLFIDVKSNLIW